MQHVVKSAYDPPHSRTMTMLMPHEIAAVDRSGRRLNPRILVMGDGGSDAVLQVHRMGSRQAPAAASPEASEEPTLSYIDLNMGELRGFVTTAHLFGMGVPDPMLDILMMTELENFEGVVLMHHGGGSDDFVSQVARKLGKGTGTAQVALVGAGARQLWSAVGGLAPAYEGPADSTLFPALKFFMREFFSRHTGA